MFVLLITAKILNCRLEEGRNEIIIISCGDMKFIQSKKPTTQKN